MIKKVYLDYAAATPLNPKVLKAMEPFLADKFYNPSAIYLAARDVRQQLEAARHKTAAILGAKPSEIIFTTGATEANNLAIQGVMRRYPEGEVLVSSIEHDSVLEPARLFKCKEIPVDKYGIVQLNKPAPHQNLSGAVGNRIVENQVFGAGLSILINDRTVLLSVMLVNNELGTIQPLKEIAGILQTVRSQRRTSGNKLPIYLHTDAAQAANYLDLHVSRLGVDLMSVNGGKIYGPKQSGALYVKAGVNLLPLIVGGGQEFGLRSGTENIAGIVGFAEALNDTQLKRRSEAKRITELRQYFETEITKLVPVVVINGFKNRAPHLLSLTFAGKDNERLMMELDEVGIMCAVGSACSAGHGETSHVLAAIGLSPADASATLRFSLGRQTTKADIQKTVKELARLTASNR